MSQKKTSAFTLSYKHLPKCRNCRIRDICRPYVQPNSLRCKDNREIARKNPLLVGKIRRKLRKKRKLRP